MNFIYYREGYKYQLSLPYRLQTAIYPTQDIDTNFIDLNKSGELHIRQDYAWDGPSGPTFDTLNFMRGSLVHDAIYQLIGAGHLQPIEWYRARADKLLRDICREDGMSAIRAWWVYEAVRLAGGKYAAQDDPLPTRAPSHGRNGEP